jgi:hypothetical protein
MARCSSNHLWFLALLLGLLAAPLCRAESAPKDPKDPKPPKGEDNVVWAEHVTPGPAVTLRLKRNTGKSLIYEGTMDRSQQSASSYTENGSFYLNVLAVDKKDIMVKDQKKRLDLLAVWRTFTDRHRTEFLEKDKRKGIDRVLENTNDLINLGPNFEMVGTLKCYGYDAQNSVAFTTQQLITLKDGRQVHGRTLKETDDTVVFLTQEEKIDLKKEEIKTSEFIPIPHVLLNETPHYLFPLFSQKQVSPGDTWKFRVPVIIPIEQGNPPRLLPTQFTAVMIGRLREVKATADGQVAVVDYQVSGQIDTSDESTRARFPEDFSNNNRIIHRISGDGFVTVDVAKGRILQKSESFNITLYAMTMVAKGATEEPKKDENQAEIQSHYEIKLLAPGTKLKSGAVIPDYD